jgi:hypothetical protein
MTIGDLKTLLEDFDESQDGVEVRLMTQQNYPFENRIGGTWLCIPDDERTDFAPAGARDFGSRGDGSPVLYLVEGGQMGYGTRDAWANCQG